MVIPLGDENPSNMPQAWMTQALIVLNLVAFAFEILQGPGLQQLITTFGVLPIEYLHGFDIPPLHGWPFWITQFTALFLHAGWLHLIFNMLFLGIFGDNVEFAMGSLRFLVFYLLCGVLATWAHIVFNWQSVIPSLGASGAIAGVLAGYVLLYPRNRVRVLVFMGVMELPAIFVLGFWFLVQLMSGLLSLVEPASTAQTGGIAYMAHLGGFMAGLVLTPFFAGRRPQKQPRAYSG